MLDVHKKHVTRSWSEDALHPSILLILPCMSWRKYGLDFIEGRFWKVTLAAISAYLRHVDVYAIDCIVLPSTSQMLGLWSPFTERDVLKEILDLGLDSYPSWSRFEKRPQLRQELKNAVETRLHDLSQKYEQIVAFVNVKAYHETLRELSTTYAMQVLPRNVDWSAARAVPYKNIDELRDCLENIVGENVTHT